MDEEPREPRAAGGGRGQGTNQDLLLPEAPPRCGKVLSTPPTLLGRRYNGEFDRMKGELRELHAGEGDRMSYQTTLLLLFSLRLACVYTAWLGNVRATLALASLQ